MRRGEIVECAANVRMIPCCSKIENECVTRSGAAQISANRPEIMVPRFRPCYAIQQRLDCVGSGLHSLRELTIAGFRCDLLERSDCAILRCEQVRAEDEVRGCLCVTRDTARVNEAAFCLALIRNAGAFQYCVGCKLPGLDVITHRDVKETLKTGIIAVGAISGPAPDPYDGVKQVEIRR